MSKTLLLTFIVFAAACQAWCHDAKPVGESNLATTILRSSESIGNNPERSLECFSVYMPLLTEATNRYEKNYEQCLETAAAASQAIETAVAEDRIKVQTEAEDICSRFAKCSDLDSYDFFNCNYKTADSAMTTSFEIQTTSKNKMQYIEVEQSLVTYNQTACTDKCSNEYVQESSQLQNELEACLAGLEHNPEVTTSNPTTIDDTSSTE